MPELVREFSPELEERVAYKVGPAGIDIVYQRVGSADAPPVLMIMGGAAQMIHWPDPLCNTLVAHGLNVTRFDNRDAGRSTHFKNAPKPDLQAALAGDCSTASYTLSDMAADVTGLMDALGIETAHIIGASMGGQIAQTIAIEHPSRVRSLVSMMSTTGDMKVGQMDPEAMHEMFARPKAETREEVIDQFVYAMRVVGSPGFPLDEQEVRERAGRAYDRGHDPDALLRQAIATVASGDRTEKLRQLKVPTLVIHGLADRMVDVSGGRATAEAIPGAELVLIEGMGHSMPSGVRQRLADHIAEFVWRVEGR